MLLTAGRAATGDHRVDRVLKQAALTVRQIPSLDERFRCRPQDREVLFRPSMLGTSSVKRSELAVAVEVSRSLEPLGVDAGSDSTVLDRLEEQHQQFVCVRRPDLERLPHRLDPIVFPAATKCSGHVTDGFAGDQRDVAEGVELGVGMNRSRSANGASSLTSATAAASSPARPSQAATSSAASSGRPTR